MALGRDADGVSRQRLPEENSIKAYGGRNDGREGHCLLQELSLTIDAGHDASWPEILVLPTRESIG
jgi:hypothetical protein